MTKERSLGSKRKLKKLPLKRQKKVIQLFNNLFKAGFNLTEIVSFLKKSNLMETRYTTAMEVGLMSGLSFSTIMGALGFSDDIVTQLSLADKHGNIHQSLDKLERYLSHLLRVKKKLIEVATYPILLVGFLLVIMLGLKNYLLPQLDEGNFATRLIQHFPSLFLIGIGSLGFLFLLCKLVSKKVAKITWFSKWSRVPFIGLYIKLYLTAYYAREWGNLISQGLDMIQIVQIMQGQTSQLFREIGKDMETSLLSGGSFHGKVLDYPFFLRELSLMIEYGEVKSKLGSELTIYAEEVWETFFSKITKSTQLIQPLIFMLVALMIVMIYVAMLLPMYQSMELSL